MTNAEREIMIDLIALLEAYVQGRLNWDGSTKTQAKVTITEARKLLAMIRENEQ